ncbi:preprotein translocase subunit SecE [Agrococcus casei]|uniref:preprotein translocase subunit SecE n=1 Tax=Agrococcus casei TaxID=343512 RepID=UPI001F25E22F
MQKRNKARNPFVAVVTFIKEVFAELSKVVTPTKRELISYTTVVLVFVALMMLFVFGLDALSAWIMANLFGNGVVLN